MINNAGINETDEFGGESDTSNISSPLPSFPNKQSNIIHITARVDKDPEFDVIG